MSEHTDVAAYSLGLLDPQDRLEFEAHLAGCESCAAELSGFVGLAELLAGIEPVDAEPVDAEPTDARPINARPINARPTGAALTGAGSAGPGAAEPDEAEDAVVVELISRHASARRQRARQRLVLAAAAGLVVLGGGIAAGMATASGPAPLAARPIGQAHSATDELTGVSGTVHLVAKPFGTQITLDLSGVHGPLTCQLIAVSKAGQREIAVGWRVPATGYGVPGHSTHLVIIGGTAIMPHDLSRLVVEVVGGGTVLSIPI